MRRCWGFWVGGNFEFVYPASIGMGQVLTIENGFLDVAFNGLGNVLQEFVLRKLSTGVKGRRRLRVGRGWGGYFPIHAQKRA